MPGGAAGSNGHDCHDAKTMSTSKTNSFRHPKTLGNVRGELKNNLTVSTAYCVHGRNVRCDGLRSNDFTIMNANSPLVRA